MILPDKVWLSLCWAMVAATVMTSVAQASPADSNPTAFDDRFGLHSRTGRYIAIRGPGGKSTIAFRRLGPGFGERLWSMPGWSPFGHLSEDGAYLVRCHLPLAPSELGPDAAVISIYRNGNPSSVIRLGQIAHDQGRSLPLGQASIPSACLSFSLLHQFTLETVDHHWLEYDVTTGRLVSLTTTDPENPPLRAAEVDWNCCPLIVPDGDVIRSANQRYFAVPGPKEKSTGVFFRVGPRFVQRLWSVASWDPARMLSDDGKYLVDCHFSRQGQNFKPDEALVSIYEDGHSARTINFARIDHDLGHPLWLPSSCSVLDLCRGFSSLHRFVLQTIDGERLEYDIATGALVSLTIVTPTKPGYGPP